jgi:hypothetical protein
VGFDAGVEATFVAAEVLRTKRDLAEKAVGAGEAWISELSDADLADLVSLSGSPVAV